MSGNIIDRVMEIILYYVSDENKAKLTIDDPMSSFGINSVDFIKIIVAIETEYNFEFLDEDLAMDRFHTVRDLSEYVLQRVSENEQDGY